MGSVVKGRAGRWKAKYRDPNGIQRYKTFDKHAEARKFLSGMESASAKGDWSDPKLGKTLFRLWVDEWWPTTLNLRPSTRVRDESYLRNYILPWFGRMQLAQITPLEVRKWVAELDADGLAPATVRKAYQILGKALRAAVDIGFLAKSPCRGVSLPKIEHREMRFLTIEEVAGLADAIDPRYRALVLVAAYGGLRWGELVGLRRQRFDQLRGTVDIAETIVELNGGRLLPPGPPKTKAARRKVGLPRSVADELANHIGQFSTEDSDLVFPAPEGGPLRRSLFRKRVWLPALKRIDLLGLRVHDLRHTAVALWIAAGAHVKEIQARAGHTSSAVVLDKYGHLFPDFDDRLTDRLEAMLKTQEVPRAREKDSPKILPMRRRKQLSSR